MSKTILNLIFKRLKPGGFTVRYWDGEEKIYGTGPSRFTCVFHQKPPLAGAIADPIQTLGECYMNGQMDLEGNLDAMFDLVQGKHNPFNGRLTKTFYNPLRLFSKSNDRIRQREDISAHYDLGTDFFSLWLDDSMSYSCAYFKSNEDSLHTAQAHKIELVLKKMHLAPGQRLLDIGCGWGALIMEAARKYGVTAVGITLSEEQCREARRRVAEAGLSESVEVRQMNYLDLNAGTEKFDRIISIGMFEHVGQSYFKGYMKQIDKLLNPGGLSMLHTLTSLTESETSGWIEKYIFPGGYIPSLREIVALLPDFDLHVLQIESLRRHYVKTIERWYETFSKEDIADKVLKMFGERFTRMWSLYLMAAAASLRLGHLDVHQIVFSKGINDDLPMTLAGVYE